MKGERQIPTSTLTASPNQLELTFFTISSFSNLRMFRRNCSQCSRRAQQVPNLYSFRFLQPEQRRTRGALLKREVTSVMPHWRPPECAKALRVRQAKVIHQTGAREEKGLPLWLGCTP